MVLSIQETNKNFNMFFSENGIKLIYSTPGVTFNKNDLSERINQTLNNCAVTLLNSSKLPLFFLRILLPLCGWRLYNLNPHHGNNPKNLRSSFFFFFFFFFFFLFFIILFLFYFNKPIDIRHLRDFS